MNILMSVIETLPPKPSKEQENKLFLTLFRLWRVRLRGELHFSSWKITPAYKQWIRHFQEVDRERKKQFNQERVSAANFLEAHRVKKKSFAMLAESSAALLSPRTLQSSHFASDPPLPSRHCRWGAALEADRSANTRQPSRRRDKTRERTEEKRGERGSGIKIFKSRKRGMWQNDLEETEMEENRYEGWLEVI